MKKDLVKRFPVDNSSILFLATLRKTFSNIYRFSMTLHEQVEPDILQGAVDRIYRRFPTIFAAVKPGFFQYFVVPVSHPPQVQPDPGCLITMSREEMMECGLRIYFEGNVISVELFHVLTDGHGTIAILTTLAAEYLRIRHGVNIPVSLPLYDINEEPTLEETEDAYLVHQGDKPYQLPSRYSYQLPGVPNEDWRVFNTCIPYSTARVLEAARRYGVSANSLLSGVMAASVMEVQVRHQDTASMKPVRVMVPVNLRRMFSSGTLRNFALYVLPTIEPEERDLPLKDYIHKFHYQIKDQISKEMFASIMANNAKLQKLLFFRMLPASLKFAVLRLGYQFFGESNSSVTVTNLGNLKLPEQMRPYVHKIDVIMTPRRGSPYGCTVISYQDQFMINISRFCHETELIDVFCEKLEAVLNG